MKSDDDIHSRLTKFGITLVETLEDQVTPEGQIIDPRRDVPVPNSHYANTCFAVAGFRAAERTGSKGLRRAARRSLQYYLDLDGEERGHGEFNAFALLELILDAREGQYKIPVSEAQLTDAIEFESTIDSQQGNNWLLLRGLCHHRLANLFGNWRDSLASRRIRRVVKYWSQNDGVLADSPRFPIAPVETPLTYHAKLSSLCAHLGSEANDEWFVQTALDGFRALSRATLPSGEALYYGRSENTLFGYSTALNGAFQLSDDKPWLSELRYRLSLYLLSSFDPEQATCLPGGKSARSVDDYVYDGVYSAYAAMMLLGLQGGCVTPSEDTEEGVHTALETSGLTAATGERSALGMATKGQVKFTKGVPDARYAGLVPLSFTIHGEHVCPGVPSSFIMDRTPPYLPIAVRNTGRYVPVTWSGRQKQTSGRLTIMGDGSFYPVGQHSTPGDDSKEPRVSAWLSVPKQICRYAARKTKAPLYLERRQKCPENISVEVRRNVHFLTEFDVLVVQTATVADNEWAILPTSFVVNPSFETHTTVTFADSAIPKRSKQVSTHQGVGTWIQPECAVSDSKHWSTIVVDPNGVTSGISTKQCGEILQTVVKIDGDVSTLELHLPELSADQTE